MAWSAAKRQPANPQPESTTSAIQIAMKFYVVGFCFHMELFCVAHVKLLQLKLLFSRVGSLEEAKLWVKRFWLHLLVFFTICIWNSSPVDFRDCPTVHVSTCLLWRGHERTQLCNFISVHLSCVSQLLQESRKWSSPAGEKHFSFSVTVKVQKGNLNSDCTIFYAFWACSTTTSARERVKFCVFSTIPPIQLCFQLPDRKTSYNNPAMSSRETNFNQLCKDQPSCKVKKMKWNFSIFHENQFTSYKEKKWKIRGKKQIPKVQM